MKFKNLVLVNSLVVFLFGAAFMIRPFGPSGMTALYDVVQNGWGVTGLLAVTLVGFGIVLSSVAYTVPEERQQLVTVACCWPICSRSLLASRRRKRFGTQVRGGRRQACI